MTKITMKKCVHAKCLRHRRRDVRIYAQDDTLLSGLMHRMHRFLRRKPGDSTGMKMRKPARERQVEQMAELVVLNEKLKQWESEQEGGEAWIDCRNKVEWLKTRKKNWEMIFESITSHQAEATLSDIETTNSKINRILDEETRNKMSVVDAKSELTALQEELKQAHERLHLSQARLDFLSDQLVNLQSEAQVYKDCQDECELEEVWSAGKPLGDQQLLFKTENDVGILGTKSWYPVEFFDRLIEAASTSQSGSDSIAFELEGVPWVLFLDNEGKVACIKDECAHRACPLSLGTVKSGCIQCPYHGWEYDGSGKCTSMPSTNTKNISNIGVNALNAKVSRDGLIWVLDPEVLGGFENDSICPPSLLDAQNSEMLISTVVDGLAINTTSLLSLLSSGSKTLAVNLYSTILDWAIKRPLTVGFALDPSDMMEVKNYSFQFVSQYSVKISLESDVKDVNALGIEMIFACVPETKTTTRLLFGLYRKFAPGKRESTKSSKTGALRWLPKLPFHNSAVNEQWGTHIENELRKVFTQVTI